MCKGTRHDSPQGRLHPPLLHTEMTFASGSMLTSRRSMLASRCLLSAAFTRISSKILYSPGTCKRVRPMLRNTTHSGRSRSTHVADGSALDHARSVIEHPHRLGDGLNRANWARNQSNVRPSTTRSANRLGSPYVSGRFRMCCSWVILTYISSTVLPPSAAAAAFADVSASASTARLPLGAFFAFGALTGDTCALSRR